MTCKCTQLSKARPMFGKTAHISIIGPEGPCSARVLESALNVAESFEATVDRTNPYSEISYISDADVGSYIPVSDWLWRALQVANDISYRTDGLFDVVAAGTDGRAHWTDLDLSCQGLVRTRKKLSVSLSGLSRGFAVDLAVKALQEVGVQAGLVDIGGRIRAFGIRDWRVEFSQTAGSGKAPSVPVPVSNDAIAGYGGCFGHSKLYDFENNCLSSSREWPGLNMLVRSRSCAVADALTKVAALTPKDSQKLLKQFGAKATILSSFGTEELKYAS